MIEEYWKTDAGRLAVASYRYFAAAETLFFSTETPRLMLAPVLHLAAHGCEVLLKSTLCYQEESAADLQDKFGHRLAGMWVNPKCSAVREMALSYAEYAGQAAGAKLRGKPRKKSSQSA